MQISRNLPVEEEKRILDKAHLLSEKMGYVTMIQQGVGIFLVLPFGLLIRMRYLEKKKKKSGHAEEGSNHL